ncbi:AMP-binding protein [Sodalis sp. RH21]|uniref:ApeI family dehydratase n=1 Tax=unclassified Sodalis (in: enterobacteria) TaxID=2636512 RepID=UPI0039B4D631
MDNQKAPAPRRLTSCTLTEPLRWLSGDRPDATLVAWRDAQPLTLGQLREDVASLWLQLAGLEGDRWALCFDDGYRFLVALLALWHRGKTPVIPGHNREKLLEEQRFFFDGVISDLPLSLSCPLMIPRRQHISPAAILPALPDDARLVLFTSGSTGRPKAVTKTLRAMAIEARWLAALICDKASGVGTASLDSCRVASSVTHQHLYGLSFGIFLPLTLGIPFCPETTRYPEHFIRQCAGRPVLFISSPAFLTRLDPTLVPPSCIGVFSAGGPLPWDDALRAGQWLSAGVTEIYGTTETGVLAWRRRRRETGLWQPFAGVAFHAQPARVRVTSALIDPPDGYWLDDRLEFSAGGQGFQIAGRGDRVIKIEEQRVSLSEIERRLNALADISEAVVMPIIKHGRQSLAAAIVLTADAARRLADGSLPTLINAYRRRLGAWLEPVAVPRYWRVAAALPRTPRGKYDWDRLKELFFTMLPIELSRRTPAEGQAELLLKLEPALFWFRGHFPGQPILPGVAQADWALHYCRDLLAPDARFSGIENIKFQRPVKPGQTLRLHLEWQAPRQLLVFRYQLCDPRQADEPTVSSGKIKLCR